MRASWEEFDYPLAVGGEVCHRLAEDIRKKLWLILYGKSANADNTSEPSGTYEGEDEAGWWGNNGPFREGNAFADFGTGGLSATLNRGPNFVDIWYDDSWGPYSVVGATQNYGGLGNHEIWFEDENIDSAGNETVGGNLLVNCPLEITEVDGDTTELNGFWRIKSKRTVNISGTDYILCRLEDFHQEIELVLLNDRGHPGTSYTKGGAAECDFGGDWYMFCPRAGIDGNIDFTSDSVMIHHYVGNVRGDGELRPPDGGRYSRDHNKYWIRTVNQNKYHHYDYNAHRWVGMAQRRGEPLVDYFTVMDSWRMLPINSDPKERVPPHWYKDTSRTAWQIAGNKVEFAKEQLTHWSTMGAAQGSQRHLRTDPSNLVRTTDIADYTVYWDSDTEVYMTGQFPPMNDNPQWHKQREGWKEFKFGSRCMWAWIEVVASRGFVEEVNATYKTNWLNTNSKVVDPVTKTGDPGNPGDTYEEKWLNGSWNLDGYRPHYNNTQPRFDHLHSIYWGENGRSIEKILSDLGDYDWWYDVTNKYVPDDLDPAKSILNRYGNIYFEEANNDDPPGDTGPAAAEWEHPTPHGTWRKVPKWTLGYVDDDEADDPGVTGFMRDKESGTPDGAEIDDYITLVHNSLEEPLVGSEWYAFHSLYSKQAPANSEFGDYATNLLDRHGPVHVHDSVAFYERAYRVLNLMLDVLDELRLATDTAASVTVHESDALDGIWIVPEAYGDPDLTTLHNRVLQWIETNFDTDPTDWPAPVSPAPKLRSQMIYGWRDPNWELSGTPLDFAYYRQIAIKFTGLVNSDLYVEMFARITIHKMGSVKKTWSHAAVIEGLDELITQEEFTGSDIYKYISGDKIGDANIEFMRLWLVNHGVAPVWQSDVPLITWLAEIYCVISAELMNADLGIIFVIDWDAIADIVWQRDDTYAKKSLLDPTEDDKPPIYEPMELFLPPTIYDANKPESDYYGLSYNWADYIAEWHIKIAGELMIDLEGNGVEYDYVGSGGTGDPTAEDFGSGEQEAREYDFILDMGAANSAEFGNEQDLEQAFDNGLTGWAFKVRAKDNASAAGAGQTDNYTGYSVTSQIVAEEGTICSPKGVWDQVPIEDVNDVEMSIKLAFGPAGDRTCEYRFETTDASWARDWSSSPDALHEGIGPGFGKTYRCFARTVDGQITQLKSLELEAV